MKVLIADDDVYTREGLVESIDWEDCLRGNGQVTRDHQIKKRTRNI